MILRTQMGIAMGLLASITASLCFIATYQAQEDALLKGIDDKLITAAYSAKELLPSDFHDNIVDKRSLSQDEYLEIVDKYNKLCSALDLEYIWSLMMIDEKFVFTTGTSTSKDVNKGDHALFFETHSDPKQYEEVFRTMVPVHQTNEDKWGKIRVVLVPFKDKQNRKYMFGASMSDNTVHAAIFKAKTHAIIMVLIILGASISIGVALSSSISRPIVELTSMAERIAAGDYGQQLSVEGTHELKSLATSIHKIDSSIQEKMTSLESSKEELRTILDRSPCPTVITKKNGDILAFNKSFTEQYGYTINDISLAHQWWEQVYPDKDYREKVQKSWETAIDEANTKQCDIAPQQWTIIAKDRSEHTVEFSMVPLDNVSIITMNDLTELIEAHNTEQELQDKISHAQRLESLGVLAGGVAHDLNNALGPIVTLPDLLLYELRDAENNPPDYVAIRSDLDVMHNSAVRAASTVKELMILGSSTKFDLSLISANHIVNNLLKTAEMHNISKQNPGIQLKLHLSKNMDDVLAAESHLDKALFNIIRNSFESMTERGTLTIKTNPEHIETAYMGYEMVTPDSYITISITDTGCGIPPEDLDRILDPFFTRKSMAANSGGGLGLGITHRIVKDHNGFIDIKSKIGSGTTFTIYLPAKTNSTNDDTNQQQPSNLKIARILIVDDEPNQRFTAKRTIERMGHIVTLTSDGRSSINIYKEEARKTKPAHPFDLIILDMIMKDDCDGLTTMQEILKVHPDQKILIASGHAESERGTAARNLGASWIYKPYSKSEMTRAVNGMLDSST